MRDHAVDIIVGLGLGLLLGSAISNFCYRHRIRQAAESGKPVYADTEHNAYFVVKVVPERPALPVAPSKGDDQ